MLHKPNNNKVYSTRKFNTIGKSKKVLNDICPIGVIELQSSANSVSQAELKSGAYRLTLDKLADGNVTTTMVCGLHTMWSVTTNYNDAKSIYNYYLERW